MIFTKGKKLPDSALEWHNHFAFFPVDLVETIKTLSGGADIPTDKVAWLQIVERKRVPMGEYSEYLYREVVG